MKGFEDPYQSEGTVQLKIEKLSQFAQGIQNPHQYSAAINIRGLKWRIYATSRDEQGQVQKSLGCFLECNMEDNDPVWSCTCSSILKILAQKDDKEDYVRKNYSAVYNAEHRRWGWELPGTEPMTFEALMNPEFGWYDELTDSIILHVQIAANAPHGVKNMPDDVYTAFIMRSEHSLFLEFKDGYGYGTNSHNTSSLAIEDKLWSFSYSPGNQTLNLEMSMHQSDTSIIAAECIFWYWKDKEIAILQKNIHKFGVDTVNIFDSGMKFTRITVPTNGSTPVKKKFYVVVRLLDQQSASAKNSMEPYYGNYDEGVQTVKLNISGETKEETFIVPKHDLMRVSPVFRRMFTNETTEKATGQVEIKETNPEEFGDFLRAISPKQELPNPSNVFALLKLADRYHVQLLRHNCENHLMNCIEIPMIHRLTCSNFYRLNKLKNNLMVSLDGTGLIKLLQQTEPHFGILKQLAKKRKHT